MSFYKNGKRILARGHASVLHSNEVKCYSYIVALFCGKSLVSKETSDYGDRLV
jgi:hypothetical protein